MRRRGHGTGRIPASCRPAPPRSSTDRPPAPGRSPRPRRCWPASGS
ncbi:hypothetical protein ACFFX0_07165 [Citricoccus parietis]|uniref:Uncharacterized protein n=1 Tax=Citricoccus parietis TaxID=592307 RepID=A0ABV5FWB9_9MICC